MTGHDRSRGKVHKTETDPAQKSVAYRSIIYQLESVNCGRCPKEHGPYWYAYASIHGGRMAKVYVGKKLNKPKAQKLLRAKLQAAGVM